MRNSEWPLVSTGGSVKVMPTGVAPAVDGGTMARATGERADVIVSPEGAAGDELVLMSLLYNRGYGSVEYRDQPQLVTLGFADGPAYSGPAPSAVRRSIEPLSTEGATKVDVELTLAKKGDGFEYGINGVAFAKNKPVRAKPGETQVWTIVNQTKWSHPFHLHGFSFLVLDADGGMMGVVELGAPTSGAHLHADVP